MNTVFARSLSAERENPDGTEGVDYALAHRELVCMMPPPRGINESS